MKHYGYIIQFLNKETGEKKFFLRTDIKGRIVFSKTKSRCTVFGDTKDAEIMLNAISAVYEELNNFEKTILKIEL